MPTLHLVSQWYAQKDFAPDEMKVIGYLKLPGAKFLELEQNPWNRLAMITKSFTCLYLTGANVVRAPPHFDTNIVFKYRLRTA